MDYPAQVDKAPNRAGVYMFINDNGEVIYIGKASGGRLSNEIKAKKYRWFRTNSDEVAKELEADWLKKYQPQNNKIGKESSPDWSSA